MLADLPEEELLREGVAKDRVISTVDPEMRHGHRSSPGRWDGWKKHMSVEPETELITAVEVSVANVNDGHGGHEPAGAAGRGGHGPGRGGGRSPVRRWA